MILVLGKAKSHKVPNLGCRGAESPGGFDVLPKNSARDVTHEWAHCVTELPVTSYPQLWPSESYE